MHLAPLFVANQTKPIHINKASKHIFSTIV